MGHANDPFCWHILPSDPPDTKPYVTWGGPDTCPVCHPELYEPYLGKVATDFNSGYPYDPQTLKVIDEIIHCGVWLQRKKVQMDPSKPLTTPVAEVRKQVASVDQYGESWITIDGIETKVATVAQAKLLLAQQDAIRADIREKLDAEGIRDRVVKTEIEIDGEMVEVGMLPPVDTGAVFSIPDGLGGVLNTKHLYSRPAKVYSVAGPKPKRKWWQFWLWFRK